MINAAGILFVTADKLALFLKRGNGSDHPLEWCCPGGQTEDDETPEQTAIRETQEECGYAAKADDLTLHTHGIAVAETAQIAQPDGSPPLQSQDVSFTTFLCRVDKPFDVTLCPEHTGYAWAALDNPPEPLHPGVRVALDRLNMDEMGVAQAMSTGALTSPQTYANTTLFNIRITGTGVAYRQSIDEFVWRNPELYLTPEFLQRCNGLPVIFEHPDKAALDSKEFSDRIVGTTILAYIKGDEVWGIARLYDAATIKMLIDEPASTSPAVVFDSTSDNFKMKLETGEALLIEGKPMLLDHIALLPNSGKGVWDKGGESVGVDRSAVAIADADAEPIPAAPKKALDPGKLRQVEQGLALLDVRLSNHMSRRRA